MKIASEWSDSISVRGDYSAEVLAHYGIDNVTITGCPPLLSNLDASHRVAKPQRQVTRVALKCSGGRPEERLFRRCWRGRAPRLRSSATSADQPPERASPETCLAAGPGLRCPGGVNLAYIYALDRQNEDAFAQAFPTICPGSMASLTHDTATLRARRPPAFSTEHRKRIRSANPLERIFAEVRRRTSVIARSRPSPTDRSLDGRRRSPRARPLPPPVRRPRRRPATSAA
ncbi:hypothetical protein BH18ACT13_BH18ACT13_17120 [soil metagenome]